MFGRRRNIAGFTVLEILTTVLIVSVLATLSVVGFRKAIAHQRLTGDTNTAISMVKYIGNEARVSKREISVLIDLDQDLIIGWLDHDSDGNVDSTEKIIDRMKTDSGVDLFSGAVGSSRISSRRVFSFRDDGSTYRQIFLVLKSEVGDEYRGLLVNPNSGWVDMVKNVPSSFK